MDRASPPIPLKDENARPLGIGRVVLSHHGGSDTVNHLTGKDTVLCHLIASVSRDQNLAAPDEVGTRRNVSLIVWSGPPARAGRGPFKAKRSRSAAGASSASPGLLDCRLAVQAWRPSTVKCAVEGRCVEHRGIEGPTLPLHQLLMLRMAGVSHDL